MIVNAWVDGSQNRLFQLTYSLDGQRKIGHYTPNGDEEILLHNAMALRQFVAIEVVDGQIVRVVR